MDVIYVIYVYNISTYVIELSQLPGNIIEAQVAKN